MPCTSPLKAYKTTRGVLGFDLRLVPKERVIEIACGQCMSCRLRKKRDWAMRLVHETQSHWDSEHPTQKTPESCFLTLTYNGKELPADRSIEKREWQLFMKKLRKKLGKEGLKYFAVGEYGDGGRPHYHGILYGHDFRADREFWKEDQGNTLWVSKMLEETWGKGFCTIGEVTFDSAAYCAGYVTKKVSGELADSHYERVSNETGECWHVEREWSLVSSKPRGIGYDFWKRHWKQIYEQGEVSLDGKSFPPPAYYDKLMAEDPRDEEKLELLKSAKEKRLLIATSKPESESTPERHAVRDRIIRDRLNKKKQRNGV